MLFGEVQAQVQPGAALPWALTISLSVWERIKKSSNLESSYSIRTKTIKISKKFYASDINIFYFDRIHICITVDSAKIS